MDSPSNLISFSPSPETVPGPFFTGFQWFFGLRNCWKLKCFFSDAENQYSIVICDTVQAMEHPESLVSFYTTEKSPPLPPRPPLTLPCPPSPPVPTVTARSALKSERKAHICFTFYTTKFIVSLRGQLKVCGASPTPHTTFNISLTALAPDPS